MSKLSFLQGKSKTFVVGEVELELKPLSLKDMDLFTIDKNASQKEQIANSLKLIDKVLLEAVPDSTPEERQNVGIKHMEVLMDAIMEVNGLKDKVDVHEVIKSRQNQTKSSE